MDRYVVYIKNNLSAFPINRPLGNIPISITVFLSLRRLKPQKQQQEAHLDYSPVIQPNTKMRPSPRLLLATPASIGSKSSLTEARALLPPLQLYRRILRVHRRKLQPEMRVLGDSYVKSEFRLHKNVENPLHIVCSFCTCDCIWWWMGWYGEGKARQEADDSRSAF